MKQKNKYHRERSMLPSNKSFGLTIATVLLLIGCLSFYKYGHWKTQHSILFASAGTLVFLSFFFERVLFYPNRYWMAFGAILHKIMNPLIMGVLFFGVLTPVALVIRLLKIDLLKLKANEKCSTYWIDKNPSGPPPENMKFQF